MSMKLTTRQTTVIQRFCEDTHCRWCPFSDARADDPCTLIGDNGELPWEWSVADER